jgi:pSer/pThr/pTyr-binding forkhead associated (FHA) protein
VQGGPSAAKTAPKDQGELVARINGQTHRLGKPHRLRTIHIGSGPRNTIRVCDKAVSDRHVQLYRRGSSLMIRNVGTKPITVNNLPLAPKAKRLLVLPAVIGLSETSTLHLSLLKLKETAPAGRRDAHEEADSK